MNGGAPELAVRLFEQEEWELCLRECRRVLLATAGRPIPDEEQAPESRRISRGTGTNTRCGSEDIRLLEARCLARLEGHEAAAREKLEDLVETGKERETVAVSAYELGRVLWRRGEREKALVAFERAFMATREKDLFLRSACSIFLLFKEEPRLKRGREYLVNQVNTSRSEWYGALFSECAAPDAAKDGKPIAPIRFYRSQISPAIGERCVLDPSCSEYFHRARKKHGLLGIPMIADRFFREPGVVHRAESPVVLPDGRIRYRDPIADHDFWMESK